MVKRLSDNIAKYISHQLDYDHERQEILAYGLEVFIGDFLKIVTILILSLVLGIFIYTLIGMISFMTFRTYIGGAHNDTYVMCFTTSLFIMLCIGVLGKVCGSVISNNLWIAFFVYGQAIIATLIWVPAGTEKKNIKNPILRKKIKIEAIALLTVWIILMLLSSSFHYQQYAFSSILGVGSAFFLVTPLAYTLFKSQIL